MWELQGALAEIAGLPHVSLQPSAGSHGELAGVLLTRAFHEANGETRHKILTPDTAHGTNPATVTMGGYEVVKVDQRRRRVDVEDLKAKCGDDVACLMLTNPTRSACSTAHRGDPQSCHDGRDALLRRREPQRRDGPHRPGDMGFDIVHSTSTRRSRSRTAAAARAPGRSRLDRSSPTCQPARCQGATADLDSTAASRSAPARLPGQLRRFRALYAYILSLGRRRPHGGLRDRGAERQLPAGAAEGDGRRAPPAGLRPLCMHEFVLSARR
jgi:glycine dehydrogenase subunit 2